MITEVKARLLLSGFYVPMTPWHVIEQIRSLLFENRRVRINSLRDRKKSSTRTDQVREPYSKLDIKCARDNGNKSRGRSLADKLERCEICV